MAEAAVAAVGSREVDAATLKRWLDSGEAVLLDVREPAEYAAAHIPQAVLRPSSKFDPAQVDLAGAQKIVVHCASGMRASGVCDTLRHCGCDNVYLFRSGVGGWREAGFETEGHGGREPLPLIRQVQLTVGVGILASLGLSFVSSWFLVLTACFGCGLILAGLTGSCPLADVMAKLPHNQHVGGSCSR